MYSVIYDVYSYYNMCVLILLYTCPHTAKGKNLSVFACLSTCTLHAYFTLTYVLSVSLASYNHTQVQKHIEVEICISREVGI
jgi:hypothetical protein